MLRSRSSGRCDGTLFYASISRDLSRISGIKTLPRVLNHFFSQNTDDKHLFYENLISRESG